MTWVVAARCDVQKCDQNATINAGVDITVKFIFKKIDLKLTSRHQVPP